MATAAGPRIVEVAEQILADIRSRGLAPGDAYLNTADVARLLKVSGSTVNRALQLLAQRGVIRRRQRRGSFIADQDGRSKQVPLQRVHLIVREDHLRSEGLWADGVLLGLQGALPGVELQFNFRPETAEADYVEQLIHDILGARQSAGLVLIRSTVVTQRLVVASGLPAVVSGTLQPSVHGLASIDRDQRQIGVLLAEYLLRNRCRQFLVLMRDRLTAGDHAMLDGSMATLAAAGVPLDAVKMRCLPTDIEAIAAEVESLVAAMKGRIGCLCRSEPLARSGRRGVERPAAKRSELSIVVADVAHRLSDGVTYPCIEPTLAPEAWGGMLGRMLAAAARGERVEPDRLIIPVRLWTPAPSGGSRA